MGVTERREREKQNRREEILETARELFYSRGYEKTRMVDIAERLELSKGTVYLYFKSKEELAYEVLLAALDLMGALLLQVEESRGSERVLDRLRSIALGYVTFFQEHYREFHLVQVLEGALYERLNDPDRAPEFYGRLNRIRNLVTEAIRRGLDDGSLRGDLQPELSAATYMITVDGFMRQLVARSHFIRHTTGHSREALIEEIFRVLTYSLQGAGGGS